MFANNAEYQRRLLLLLYSEKRIFCKLFREIVHDYEAVLVLRKIAALIYISRLKFT